MFIFFVLLRVICLLYSKRVGFIREKFNFVSHQNIGALFRLGLRLTRVYDMLWKREKRLVLIMKWENYNKFKTLYHLPSDIVR